MKSIITFTLMLIAAIASAQSADKYTLSGHIRDMATGEELISASLFVEELSVGNTTNVYGYYALTLPAGKYEVRYSYIGYQTQTITIDLQSDLRYDIELPASSHEMEEIIISAEEEDQNIQAVEMSKINIDVEAVKKMPALFGEVDIIKAIQLLPGVKSIGEGTSGFYVRGGNADQNLVLLDEAPIYNASHLLGFFSSFNPDAIKDMQLSKGAISSRYGGRLSSVLDIRMKEGNNKSFGGSAGIGTIMSRLSLEAPIGEKGSFIVSGRRSYLDVIAKSYQALKGDSSDNDFTFYFYDLNAKGNYKISDNDRIFLSGYFGRDVIGIEEEGINIDWGNKTSTIRWNHIFSPSLFANLTFYSSTYDYGLTSEEGITSVDWQSELKELSAKLDFTSFVSPSHTLHFGGQSIRHKLSPGDIKIIEEDTLTSEFTVEEAVSIENAIYISDEWTVNSQLKMDLGLRVSSLHNIGPHTHYKLDSTSEDIDTTLYSKKFYNNEFNIEPRLGLKYSMKNSSIKLSYNRMAQYIQQASNGNSATPFDIWFTSSPNVKPQIANQWAAGYFRNFRNNTIEASIEVYYKTFSNSIDFKENAQLLLNKNLEGELRIGEAKAYGIEFLLKKDIGRLTGWVGYTYSKIEKNIDGINEGRWYNAKYDKPHDLSVVLSYELNNRMSISSNFVYSSGSPVTFPTGRYEYNGVIVPVYSDRNGARLPNYHRMDLSLSIKPKKNENRRMKSEWVISIYNVYNRKNAFAINFRQDEINPRQTYAEKSSVFSVVPSVTYNIKF